MSNSSVAITPIPIPSALLQQAFRALLPLPQPRPTLLGFDGGNGI